MANPNTIDELSSGDMFTIWLGSSGQYAVATPQVAAEAIEPYLTAPSEYSTQYSAPSATGFTTTVVAGSLGQTDIRLIITPAAGYANGTIVLPLASTCVDH